MEQYSIEQILDRMDARTEQIAQIISGQTAAIHNLARIADVMSQSLTAIAQRQVLAMEVQAHALEVSSQALRVSTQILARMETK